MTTKVGRVALFLYVWLTLGFILGTVVLVWLTRAITAWTRGRGDAVENVVMWGVMLALLVGSFFAARWIAKRSSAARSPVTRFLPLVALSGFALFALWAWLQPNRLAAAGGGAESEVTMSGTGGAQFVFGPYATGEKLEQLKSEGYAGVISLQHPAVLPFEPSGIASSKANTSRLGLRFIHAPMVPWVSENEESLARIRRIAETETGKFYVHCGLGRDRTNIVKRMLERMGARTAAEKGFATPRSFAVKKASMERGRQRELEPDFWLIPYPNKHELFGNMLAGQVSNVVSLLDTAGSAHRPWVEESRRLFREYAVPLAELPLKAGDRTRAEDIVRRARRLPRPLVVIVPGLPPKPDTVVGATFLRAYRVVCATESCPPPPTRTVSDP